MAAKKKAAAAKPVKAKAAPKAKAKAAPKAAPKKAAASKAKAAPVAAKKAVAKKAALYAAPVTKTQMVSTIAENTELTRKQVTAVLEELNMMIEGHLKKKGGAGVFTMPGLFKIVTKHKPAQKARKGLHPITKEPTTFKAKPASVQVKIRPLKKVKDMAQ